MLRVEKTDGLPREAKETPREGLWNGYYQKASYQRQVYGDDTSVLKGCAFLNSPDIDTIEDITIEDWGCGYGGVKLYSTPHQQDFVFDGSQIHYADEHADLERHVSDPVDIETISFRVSKGSDTSKRRDLQLGQDMVSSTYSISSV